MDVCACSAVAADKTGTLTENRMTVVEGWFAGKVFTHVPAANELPDDVLDSLSMNCSMNSKVGGCATWGFDV